MRMFLKGVLVYSTFATIIFFILALDSIVFSMWFLPIILFIIAEIIAINRLVYWDELKRILFID
jgi:hypothetical protein